MCRAAPAAAPRSPHRDVADLGDPVEAVRRRPPRCSSSNPIVWACDVRPRRTSRGSISSRSRRVQQRQVGAVARCQVDVGFSCDRGGAGVDGEQPRRVRCRHAGRASASRARSASRRRCGPTGRSRRSGRRRCTSRAGRRCRRLLQRRRGGGGAEPGVAVHVRGADAGLADHAERVVLLEEELAAGVEADAAPAAGLGQQFLGTHAVMASIAVSQSVSTSWSPLRTSGRRSRSGALLACQPNRSFGSSRPC